MSCPQEPKPVKCVSSLIYSDHEATKKALSLLKQKLGEIDFIEADFPFTFTEYYAREMGRPLWRSFFGFKTLILRETLVDIKLFTNEIENSLAKEDGRRTLNIDPGYLNDSQFVLATGKNFSHRIYLGRGLFGDLTLMFKHSQFQAFPWTYPDYREEPIRSLLLKMRKDYVRGFHEK
ncbi:MAG: DUF4416 family protein [Deltaproteobacteria bacterium]|nr:DUF4416 family protein [Deltaproteobacteria bacterium]